MGTIDWFEHVRAEELSALEGALRNHFPRAELRQDIDDVGDVHALDLDTQRPRSAACGFASRLQRCLAPKAMHDAFEVAERAASQRRSAIEHDGRSPAKLQAAAY